MNWREWIDVETLKAISCHVSGVLGTVLSFMFIAYIIKWGLEEGFLRTLVELMEGFLLVGILLNLLCETVYGVWVRWLRRLKNGSSLCFLVA